MRRTGGISKKGKRNKIQVNNRFFSEITADYTIRKLLPHIIEKENMSILDACCGNGILGHTLKKYYYKSHVVAVDIKLQDTSFEDISLENKDILDYCSLTKFDIIICNPPWIPVEYAQKVYNHLQDFLTDEGIMFFIINNTFWYQGWERGKLLGINKFYFFPRFVFRWCGSPLLDCGVGVNHKNNDMPKGAIEQDSFIYIPSKYEYVKLKED